MAKVDVFTALCIHENAVMGMREEGGYWDKLVGDYGWAEFRDKVADLSIQFDKAWERYRDKDTFVHVCFDFEFVPELLRVAEGHEIDPFIQTQEFWDSITKRLFVGEHHAKAQA